MPEPAVNTDKLRKCFGDFCAVNDIDITVEGGEFFGFLGPNGAGKSTLIRMLTTVMKPTSGGASVAGFDIRKQAKEVRRAIGVVPQSLSCDLDMTGYENMDIYGKFYEVPKKERRERTDELLDRVGLTNKASELAATYSGGMRRRLEIARSLIHIPKILFRDEPTTGLDPQSRRLVWDMLNDLQDAYGLTIFLTTHYMDEAEELCGRVAIIDRGNIIQIGSPKELKDALPGNDTIILDLDPSDIDKAQKAVEKEPYVHKTTVEGAQLRCYVDEGGKNSPRMMGLMSSLGIEVGSLAIKRLSLEDVFIHHTGRTIREEDTKKVSMILGAGVPQKWGR